MDTKIATDVTTLQGADSFVTPFVDGFMDPRAEIAFGQTNWSDHNISSMSVNSLMSFAPPEHAQTHFLWAKTISERKSAFMHYCRVTS